MCLRTGGSGFGTAPKFGFGPRRRFISGTAPVRGRSPGSLQPHPDASSHLHPAFRAFVCTALSWNRRLQVPISVKSAQAHTLVEEPLHEASAVSTIPLAAALSRG